MVAFFCFCFFFSTDLERPKVGFWGLQRDFAAKNNFFVCGGWKEIGFLVRFAHVCQLQNDAVALTRFAMNVVSAIGIGRAASGRVRANKGAGGGVENWFQTMLRQGRAFVE